MDGTSAESSATATAFGGTRFEYDEEHDLVEYERAVGLVGEGGGDTALRA